MENRQILFGGYSFPMGLWPGRRMVTQLFEAAYLAVLCGCMLAWLKRNKFAWYLFLYGVGRFCLEFLRGDNRGTLWGAALSPSQVLSVVMCVTGLILLAVQGINRRLRKN